MESTGIIYSDEELIEMALTAIKEYNLVFLTDIVAYLPISRATFYNRGLDKLDTLKTEITNNKIQTKQALRAKWFNRDNATTQIALYRLLADDDELRRLQNNTDIKPEETGEEFKYNESDVPSDDFVKACREMQESIKGKKTE